MVKSVQSIVESYDERAREHGPTSLCFSNLTLLMSPD